MSDLTKALVQLTGKKVFLTTEPDVLDFTNPDAQKKSLIIQGGGMKIGVPLPSNRDQLARTVAAFPPTIGENADLLIGWNIKPFFSYCLKIIGCPQRYGQTIWDLKIIESFLGVKEPQPKTTDEAVARMTKCVADSSWSKFKPIYKQVYHPLITEVVPEMETEGLTHRGDIQDIVYSYYELDGQANGRSKTLKVLKKCFLPHSLSPKEKGLLHPKDHRDFFMSFDFCNMEVSVLQWLSDDPALGRILRGKKDVYEQIWCKATGLKRDDNSRDNGKSTFLPVVYGLGSKGLAKRLGKREDLAAWIINSYYKSFPKAFQWIRQQSLDAEGQATDHFGRKRMFDEENLYKIRNFLVQAPANIICLKKLITLRESIKDFAKLAFHLHDGYCILVKNTDWKKAYLKATEALETEDKLFPNLRLTTSCEAGVTLKSLKPISRR